MAAASSNPWNETPARRPGAADFGAGSSGFILADEGEDDHGNDISPIRDGTQPYAAMFNRALEACAVASACIPALSVSVRFTGGGVPEVDSFISPRTTRKIEDVKVVDVGTGITIVRVVDDTIPSAIGGPIASVHEGTKPTILVEPYSDTGWRGAKITTWDNGTLANLKFSVEIF